MSSTPIRKQLIGLIFLLFICLSVPLGAAAGTTYSGTVEPGQERIDHNDYMVTCSGISGCYLLKGAALTWSLSPNNGTATLIGASRTDNSAKYWFQLNFGPNACGTYTVTVRLPQDPRPEQYIRYVISGKPSCPPGSSSGTTSPSLSSETTSPPPSPQLIKLSDDNQVIRPEDSVTLSVQLRDSDGSPTADVDVTFFILSGDNSRASLSSTRATTDANGRAQTTLTFSADATGEYIVEAYRSDTFGLYTQFTITVDPLLPKATRLEKISGDDQTGLTGGVWAAPFVVEVLDQYDAPLEGTPVTFTVLTGGGILSAETTRTDANGLATSTLRLGAEAGTHTVEVSVEGISEPVTFTAEVPLPPATPTRLSIVSGENQEGVIDEPLPHPFIVEVYDQYGDPMAEVTVTFVVRTGGGVLSHPTATTDTIGQATSTLRLGTEAGTHTVEVSVEGITEIVTFRVVAELLEFDLSLPSGIHLIHVPLRVKTVDGQTQTIESVSDLYTALGGADAVNWLITYDAETQNWRSYLGDADRGSIADRGLTDDTGIIVSLTTAASVRLGGNALGMDGRSTLTLNKGLNVVGLPLRDSRITRVSDLFALDGIGGNAATIIVTDNGAFKTVGRVGDSGDTAITGGQAFILTAQRAETVDISGAAWTNDSGAAAASPVAIDRYQSRPIQLLS